MKETTSIYKRFRKLFGNKREDPDFEETEIGTTGLKELTGTRNTKKAYGKGRDPVAAGDIIKMVSTNHGWDAQLEEAGIFAAWPEIVGAQIAAKAKPISLNSGKLLVKCESTAWATQLKLEHIKIINNIESHFPSVRLSEIRFVGPEAPNWNHGSRTVPGRGPRDTYG